MKLDDAYKLRLGRLAHLLLITGLIISSGPAFSYGGTSYPLLVANEINRHKHYPPAARAAGVVGRVSMVFTIAPSGAVASNAITQSSGNALLDDAADKAVWASHFPPPPQGPFKGAISLNYILPMRMSAYPPQTPHQASCSDRANALGLHGSNRMEFRYYCLKEGF